MSSVVLNQRTFGSGGETLYASGGILAGSGGLTTLTGAVNAKQVVGTQLVAADDDPTGGDAGLFLLNKPVNLNGTYNSVQQLAFTVPSAGIALPTLEGCGTIFTRSGSLPPPGNVAFLVSTQVPPRGLVGPPVVNGDQAIWGMIGDYQSGSATVALLSTSIQVANTAVLATTIVMATPLLIDATATHFAVSVQAGVGFTITVNAAPTTAALPFNYFVVRY